MVAFRLFVVLSLATLMLPLPAGAQSAAPSARGNDPAPFCKIVEQTAQANALPVGFFTRLIWQESRFKPDEIGPLTRTGERAQGIAQFMPETAAERGLNEPFDPAAALPKSGEFLADLRERFGNLGLAAAAYNAGPQRVSDFIAGNGALPEETQHYVLAITGRSVGDWLRPADGASDPDITGTIREREAAPASCREVMERLERGSLVAAEPALHPVPRWCWYVHHPNLNVCGRAHEREPATRLSSLMKSRIHLSARAP